MFGKFVEKSTWLFTVLPLFLTVCPCVSNGDIDKSFKKIHCINPIQTLLRIQREAAAYSPSAVSDLRLIRQLYPSIRQEIEKRFPRLVDRFEKIGCAKRLYLNHLRNLDQEINMVLVSIQKIDCEFYVQKRGLLEEFCIRLKSFLLQCSLPSQPKLTERTPRWLKKNWVKVLVTGAVAGGLAYLLLEATFKEYLEEQSVIAFSETTKNKMKVPAFKQQKKHCLNQGVPGKCGLYALYHIAVERRGGELSADEFKREVLKPAMKICSKKVEWCYLNHLKELAEDIPFLRKRLVEGSGKELKKDVLYLQESQKCPLSLTFEGSPAKIIKAYQEGAKLYCLLLPTNHFVSLIFQRQPVAQKSVSGMQPKSTVPFVSIFDSYAGTRGGDGSLPRYQETIDKLVYILETT